MLIDFETIIYHPTTGKEIPVWVEVGVYRAERDIGCSADAEINDIRFALNNRQLPDSLYEAIDTDHIKEEALDMMEDYL